MSITSPVSMTALPSLQSGDFGVEEVRREIPDVLPGLCEAKVPAGEVANTEVTGDHCTCSRENDNEGLHDWIASLGLSGWVLIGDDQ